MKISILGASGQVGAELHRQLSTPHNTVDATRIDISDTYEMHKHCFDSDVIYLCAAVTSVDFCESDPKTIETNFVGVQNVVNGINRQEHKPLLVFYSTDYVFDGARGLYNESCLPSPINRYGDHKLLAEYFIRLNLEKYYIVRTNMVYGPDKFGKNYASRMMSQLKLPIHEPIVGVFDEWVTPTYGPDLAKRSIELAGSGETYGTYHIAGPEHMTRYHFVLKLAKMMGMSEQIIKPLPSYALYRKAKRPLNGGLTSNYGFMTTTTADEGLLNMKEVIK